MIETASARLVGGGGLPGLLLSRGLLPAGGLLAARRLLDGTRLTVAELALQPGFATPRHVALRLRLRPGTGTSPHAWRRTRSAQTEAAAELAGHARPL